MQRLTFQARSDVRRGQPNVGRHWHRLVVLLALVLLLVGCGRAEQQAEQPSPASLSPATPEATTPTSAVQGTPVLIRPTPNDAQRIASVTAAYIETGVAANDNAARATATSKAEWALTPEPTILPPADGPRLRDLWPAANQQAAPPTRLYLRSFGKSQFDPDTFWEVTLPDAQTRRLPTVEETSIDRSAQVSPDGRFLAYITGEQPGRKLRVLDLMHHNDLGLTIPVAAGVPRCLQPFAWSPNSRSLALVQLQVTSPLSRLQLYDDVEANQPPRTLVELPSPLRLLGWLDAEHLLLWSWQPKERLTQLVSVDRQGRVSLVSKPQSEYLSCGSLSPDQQTLIYGQDRLVKRLQLDTGQEEPFPWWPGELFWVGDGRKLLTSQFGTDRRVRLLSLDQPQEQSQERSSIFLSPPYQAAYKFGITGVSPDNRTLVACEQAPTDNLRISTRESRTWLYHIPTDRWTPVHTSPSGRCDLVLGWTNVGGAQ